MNLFRVLLLVVAALYLGGCAYGQKIDYSQAYPEFSEQVKPVEVLVLDERPYVLSGNKKSNYVGLIRGSYYIPYDVRTRSGQPLAHDIRHSVIGGLMKAGGKAVEARSSSLQAAELGSRLLVIRIREWKSESFMGDVLTYVLATDIYDDKGHKLASSSLAGSDGVHDYTAVGKSILTRVLAAEPIATVLAGDAVSVEAQAVPPAKRNPVPLFAPRFISDGVF